VHELEPFVFFLSLFAIAIGVGWHSAFRMHPLYFRRNPAPGIIRAAILLSMVWIWFVIANYADPSVRGFYVVFYLVMGYAAVKLFGQTTALALGARTRRDAVERRNVPAALVAGAFILATGLIFGGSLWGEADPVADDEGGWWIPVTFFLLGWGVLLGAFALFRRREHKTLAHRLRCERSIPDAKAAAAFLLSAGVTLTDAVAGDFWGWRHGLLTFGMLAVLLVVHEVFSQVARPEPTRGTSGEPADGRRPAPSEARRTAESVAYLVVAVLAWLAYRVLDLALRPG
jgi:hypothetical protein